MENPTNSSLPVTYYVSNPILLKVIPEKISIPALSAREIIIKYTPSNLDYEEDCTVLFQTEDIGNWDYRIKGKGLCPSVMESTKISTFVGNMISGTVKFKNPYNETVIVTIELKARKPRSI